MKPAVGTHQIQEKILFAVQMIGIAEQRRADLIEDRVLPSGAGIHKELLRALERLQPVAIAKTGAWSRCHINDDWSLKRVIVGLCDTTCRPPNSFPIAVSTPFR